MKTSLSSILNLIVFAALFGLCMIFVAIRVSGLGTFIVTGGSMEPAVPKGALVLVQPVSPSVVKVGDVITFQQYDQTTTHRVIAIGRNDQGISFKTQGDANVVADPEDKVFPGAVGIVRVSVPVAGIVAGSVQAYWRLVLTLIAAITFFSCASALVFRKNDTTTAARAPITASRRRPVASKRLVTVTVDADAAWNAHLDWMRRQARHRSPARAA